MCLSISESAILTARGVGRTVASAPLAMRRRTEATLMARRSAAAGMRRRGIQGALGDWGVVVYNVN
jgi:hypothetical protein